MFILKLGSCNCIVTAVDFVLQLDHQQMTSSYSHHLELFHVMSRQIGVIRLKVRETSSEE